MKGYFFQHFSKFTAKFDLVFVQTLENAFSKKFHFKANKKSIDSFKNVLATFKTALL